MADESNMLLDAALRYAKLGYRVFPCVPGGKSPVTEHGFHDATTDAAQIEQWWTEQPRANIGLATEGLLVIDIDGRDNPWLANQPERTLELASVPTALTPRGGSHRVFRQPAGKDWRCTEGRLAPKVDTRAAGGYIVAPPSVVEGVGAYQWVEGLELDVRPDALREPAPWLVAELDQFSTGSLTLAHVAAGSAEAGQIPEGQRNATLARLAGAMRRVGMTAPEIAGALHVANADRCAPPVSPREVERIAASIARYPPDEISVALVENHWGQMVPGKPAPLEPVSLADLVSRFPDLRPPVIHGLLRRGETMNVISVPKIGKSWLVTDLALSIATGRPWLDTFATEPGDVLIIDNELHGETSANRIPKVSAARQIALGSVGQRIFVQNLRGRLLDIFTLGTYFRDLQPGRFSVIILDAFYRFMPVDTDENDNGTMANVYNRLDSYADRLGCCFALIHHTSKGNQSAKGVTDVGAGAGSQSRATDTHLVLRPHEQDDVVVLEAAVRSWPPVMPRCLRWTFPVWTADDNLDPSLLRSEKPRRKKSDATEDEPDEDWTVERFVQACVTAMPESRAVILERAEGLGVSNRRAVQLLQRAEGAGLVLRLHGGRGKPVIYSTNPQGQDTCSEQR
jgi:hypothetical protein